jgi:hypothetical protein
MAYCFAVNINAVLSVWANYLRTLLFKENIKYKKTNRLGEIIFNIRRPTQYWIVIQVYKVAR